METSTTPPEPAIEQDDTIYPCKGCGEILEEGKAFELAGHRWHLDCFRCNTCGTLLDADANLLLLGDGSLICNNCTYSCYSCGNKIEDLAIILSGDQAFCANCFRCRNCKRKIENLRYARTSQGIFCMTCHESSMTARRRKKARAAAVPAQHRSGSGTPSAFLDKSLPSLPPSVSMLKTKTSDRESPASDMAADPASESPRHRASPSGHDSSKSLKRDRSPHPSDDGRKENHSFPSSSSSRKRTSTISRAPDDVSERSRRSGSFHIPLLLDTGSAPEFQDLIDSYARDGEPQPPPPERKSSRTKDSHPLDFDHAHRVRTQLPSRRSSDDPHPPSTTPSVRSAEASHGSPADASPHPPSSSRSRPPTGLSTRDSTSTGRARHERGELDRAHSHGSSREVASDERRVQHATARPPSPEGRIQSAHGERFQLQAVPRSKKSSSASHTPVSASPSPSPVGRMTAPGSDPSSAGGTRAAGATDPADAEPVPSPAPRLEHPPSRSSSLRRDHDDESAPPPPWTVHPSEVSHARTDGGRDVPARKPAPGKAVPPSPTMGPAAYATPTRDHLSPAAALASPAMALSPPSGGGAEPPAAESLAAALRGVADRPPPRARDRQPSAHSRLPSDAFTAPRAPPPPPITQPQSPRGSNASHVESPSPGRMASSSALPAYHASGDFNLEEDMERILGGTDEASTSLLRRVSNAVRHGRSASENHSRTPSLAAKWPRSPITSSMIGSPTTTTAAAEPTTGGREDTTRLTHELRRSAQKIVELEARVRGGSREVVSLEQQVQERRSTVAFLDTQKELVVRELEILTEHVAELKRSPAPFNMGVLVSDVLHEFAASLERLKQSFGPQIEALTRQKNALGDETAQLTRLRDHALQETEQLNLKNAQLAVLNNELTHQIQERYRAHREGRGFADSARAPLLPGFGLVGAGGMPARERGETAFDGREARLGAAGNGVAAVAASAGPARASHGEHGDGEPATVLTAPHVINIRKGQVKKFNWKKGGQSVAKGLKGAFSSSSQSSGYPPPQGGREAAAALEGVPYGMTPVMEAPTTSLPRSLGDTPARHGLALFGQRLAKSGPMKMQSNGNLSVATSEAPSALFGSELIERTDVERRQIPCVVTRCVEEVELRGMDVEGIYRKTGGSGQVKLIQEGFEQSNDYDISDPHLDITAVTSVLKQYLRKLPTPLITFDAYDGFLEAHQHTGDDEQRVTMMRAIINHQLPAAHRDCLEFLVFHLARVATREKENLMSPRNLSVVFAPTLMRDHSLDREMTDMHAKNQAIQFLIEHNKSIFARE